MSTTSDQLGLETAACAGVIERVTYYDPAGGWAVLAVVLDDDRRTKVVGYAALRPAQGLRVSATGRWQRHERFGLQFSADHLQVLAPANSDGLRSFLIDALPGVGPKTADRIVQAFGEQTPAALEDARRLVTFAGISAARAQKISAAWRARHADRDALVFLRGLGLGERMAERVRAQFEGEPDFARLLSENPYRLVDVAGIGFATADRAAQTIGIAPEAAFRIQAGIVHALELRAQEGHTLAPRAALLDKAKTLLGVDAAHIESELEAVLRDGRVITRGADDELTYHLPLYDRAERTLAEHVRRLSRRIPAARLPSEDQIRKACDVVPDPEQLAAVRLALGHGLSILTGGPGCGKTTLTQAISALVHAPVMLAAPTGRAAKRLAEATGKHAHTIHRLLRAQGGSDGWRFAHDETNPLPLRDGLLIVDEASMLDVLLASALLSAVPDGASVLLVGDADQLPSVGPGNVLADLIAAGVPCARLQQIYRQDEGSAIVRDARAVIDGVMPRLKEGTECHLVECDASPADVRSVIERLQRAGADPANIQVLSPMRRGALGTDALNYDLQRALNPNASGHGVTTGRRLLVEGVTHPETVYPGDRAIQTTNDYAHQLFNGELLQVLACSAPGHARWVDVVVDEPDGSLRTVRLEAEALSRVSLAYALTCHKAQGGQFEHVVLCLLPAHYVMLNRRLLYTAMTRARRSLTIVGRKRAVAMAVRDVGAPPSRDTGLAGLLGGAKLEQSLVPGRKRSAIGREEVPY